MNGGNPVVRDENDLAALTRQLEAVARTGRNIELRSQHAATLLDALAAAREENGRLREALEIIRPWIRTEPHTGTRGGIYLNSPLLSVEVSNLLRAALAREATDADR